MHAAGHRGDPRRGLQPHRRGQPDGADAVDARHRQRRLLPPGAGPALLHGLHRLRQHAQHDPAARAAAHHGQPALLGHRDARRRLPLRPGQHPGPRAVRGQPAGRLLRHHPPGPGALAGEADRRAVGRRARAATRWATSRCSGPSGTASTATASAGSGRATAAPPRSWPPGWPAAATSTRTTAASRTPASTSSPATTASPCTTSSATTTSTTRPTARTTATAPTTTIAGTAAPRGRPTTPTIIELRERQKRNLMATLLLSVGVPMMLGGDELGHTQDGNNNAYCQDNELTWLDWELDDRQKQFLDFVRKLIFIRRTQPVLPPAEVLPGPGDPRLGHQGHLVLQPVGPGDDRRGLERRVRQVPGGAAGRRPDRRRERARRADRGRDAADPAQRPLGADPVHAADDAARTISGTASSTRPTRARSRWTYEGGQEYPLQDRSFVVLAARPPQHRGHTATPDQVRTVMERSWPVTGRRAAREVPARSAGPSPIRPGHDLPPTTRDEGSMDPNRARVETLLAQAAEAAARARRPESTYRLQFHAGFTFRDATAIVPYLRDLGITHCYASPYLKARPGSTHGYDIIDHGCAQPRDRHRGGLRGLVDALHDARHGPDPRHRAQPHGRRHQRERLVERRAGERPGVPLRHLLRHRLAVLAAARAAATRSCCRSWAIPTATSSRPASSRWPSPTGRSRSTTTTAGSRVARAAMPRSWRTGSTSWRRDPGPGRPRADRVSEHPDRRSSNLPDRSETEPDKVAERQREKEVIKRRLAALAAESEPVRDFIEQNVVAVQRHAGRPAQLRPAGRPARAPVLPPGVLAGRPRRDQLPPLLRHQRPGRAEHGARGGLRGRPRAWSCGWWPRARSTGCGSTTPTACTTPRSTSAGSRSITPWPGPPGLRRPAPARRAPTGTRSKARCASASPPRLGRAGRPAGPAAVRRRREDPRRATSRWSTTWPVHGTSGYDFLNQVNGLFVDADAARAFTRLYHDCVQDDSRFAELVYRNKLLIMQVSLSSELHMLTNQLDRLAQKSRRVARLHLQHAAARAAAR